MSPKKSNQRAKRRFKFYSIYAWLIPAAIVTAGHVVDKLEVLKDYRPSYASTICWLNNRSGLALFFTLPLAALMLENLVLFLITMVGLWQQRQIKHLGFRRDVSKTTIDGNNENSGKVNVKRKSRRAGVGLNVTGVKFQVTEHTAARKDLKKRLRLLIYTTLTVITALAWASGFIAIFLDYKDFWHSFIVLNGMQGLLVFLTFDLKRKIYYMAYEKIMGRPHPALRERKLRQQQQGQQKNIQLILGCWSFFNEPDEPGQGTGYRERSEVGEDPKQRSQNRRKKKKNEKTWSQQKEATTRNAFEDGRHQVRKSVSGQGGVRKMDENDEESKRDSVSSFRANKVVENPSKSRSRSTTSAKGLLLKKKSATMSHKDLSKLDAWQQLKMFQESLSIESPYTERKKSKSRDVDIEAVERLSVEAANLDEESIVGVKEERMEMTGSSSLLDGYEEEDDEDYGEPDSRTIAASFKISSETPSSETNPELYQNEEDQISIIHPGNTSVVEPSDIEFSSSKTLPWDQKRALFGQKKWPISQDHDPAPTHLPPTRPPPPKYRSPPPYRKRKPDSSQDYHDDEVKDPSVHEAEVNVIGTIKVPDSEIIVHRRPRFDLAVAEDLTDTDGGKGYQSDKSSDEAESVV